MLRYCINERRHEHSAVVAQLDRATGYELVGWGFESLRPHICLVV
jgi:hypothetical protein